MENGYFRKKRYNFSMVNNDVLENKNLSLKAKGLYAMIECYNSIPDFVLYKEYLMKCSKEGETAFETAWKELKAKGYLISRKMQNEKGRFIYEYELL